MEIIRQCPNCGSDQLSIRRFGWMYCRSCDSLLRSKKTEKNPSDIFSKAIHSVFEIRTVAEDRERWGTAILVSENGHLLTSAHLFLERAEEDHFLYLFQNTTSLRREKTDEPIKAEVLRIDQQNDLALLSAPVLAGSAPMIPSYQKVHTGQKICVIGNSRGEGLCMVDGLVSDSHREMDGRDLFLISAPVTTGCSGGPVLDLSGFLVGMVTCGRKGEACMNYAVSEKVIRDFVREKF